MYHYKIVIDGYIVAIGYGFGGVQISDAEYARIGDKIRSRPRRDGSTFRLNGATMAWDEFPAEPEPEPIDTELSADEALKIITGGDSDDAG